MAKKIDFRETTTRLSHKLKALTAKGFPKAFPWKRTRSKTYPKGHVKQ